MAAGIANHPDAIDDDDDTPPVCTENLNPDAMGRPTVSAAEFGDR